MKERGFTLLELLLVVAIVSVLAGLLIPAMGQMDYQARLLRCRNNLRSVYTLVLAYATVNEAVFPEFHPYYGAMIFHPKSRYEPYEVTMRDVIELKRMGARAEQFFCPLNPYYGVPSWRWDSWSSPGYSVNTDYAALMNRRQTWTETPDEPAYFSDGQPAPLTLDCPGSTPLLADNLRARGDGALFGWLHGDAQPWAEHSCHTLFRDGRVEYSSWAELGAQGPGLIMGAAGRDTWWFALEPG